MIDALPAVMRAKLARAVERCVDQLAVFAARTTAHLEAVLACLTRDKQLRRFDGERTPYYRKRCEGI